MSAPTNEEHLQETLKTLNTAMNIIGQMKTDIETLRTVLKDTVAGLESASAGFTESNWEEEIARAKLGLEMTGND